MKKIFLFIALLAFLWVAGICLAGEAPHQVSDIRFEPGYR